MGQQPRPSMLWFPWTCHPQAPLIILGSLACNHELALHLNTALQLLTCAAPCACRPSALLAWLRPQPEGYRHLVGVIALVELGFDLSLRAERLDRHLVGVIAFVSLALTLA